MIPAEHITNVPHLGEVVEGWKSIAAVIGRSVWTAKELTRRRPEDDPLPVLRYLGRVFIRVPHLEAWLERQISPFE